MIPVWWWILMGGIGGFILGVIAGVGLLWLFASDPHVLRPDPLPRRRDRK
jgi:hypothetical protein